MKRKKPILAIAYDFDGTLAPGNMQEHSFIPEIKMNKSKFWKEVKDKAKESDADEILIYMELMIEKAKLSDNEFNRKSLKAHGKKIALFNGVEEYFSRVNEYGKSKGIRVKHYIISSGLRDIIEGTKIKKYFSHIFASGFKFDPNGVAVWPALAINYTNKVQYLFRINKGINNSWDNSRINKYIENDLRPVPFKNMVYLGDGETDVPAMKMLKYQGGYSIGVYKPNSSKKKKICQDLITQERADYIASADYSEGKSIDNIIKTIIDKISVESKLENLK